MDVNISNLFIDSPGNLLYFLVVIGLSQTAFFMALDQRLRRKGQKEAGAGRYVIGAAGMSVVWGALMLGALLSMRGDVLSSAVLPPLEQAANTLVLLWAGWAFLGAEAGKRAARWIHMGMAALLILVGAGYAYTGVQWRGLAETQPFNQSDFALPWAFVPVVLCALGVLLTLLRYRSTRDVPLKVVFFALAGAGYVSTLAQLSAGQLPGDYAGDVRVSMLAAAPVFVAVVYRHVIYRLSAHVPAGLAAGSHAPPPINLKTTATPPKPRTAPKDQDAPVPATARIIQAMDLMLSERDPHKIPEQVALTIATLLQADVVVVMSIDDRWADVQAAYDSVRQKFIMGLAVNLDDQPTLVQAFKTQRQAALLPESHAAELIDLYARLDLSDIGPLYVQPVISEGVTTGAITIGLSYSRRKLDEDEQNLLSELAPLVSGVMALSHIASKTRFMDAVASSRPAAPVAAEPDSIAEAARYELQEARQQIEDLTDMVRNLQIELDYQRSQIAAAGLDGDAALSISQQMEALRTERDELSHERDRVHSALNDAKTTIAAATADDQVDVLQAMVNVLTREKEELEAQRDVLQSKLRELDATVDDPDVIAQMLTSLTEETARLVGERDRFATELQEVRLQLESLGVEDGATGLAQLLGTLYDQRAQLSAQLGQLTVECDQLAGERDELLEDISDGEGRAELSAQLQRLANDREALSIQRDRIAHQLEDAYTRLAALEAEHKQSTAQLSSRETALQKAVAFGRHLDLQRRALDEQVNALEAQTHDLTAHSVTLEAERDQLYLRLAGREEELETLNVELKSIQALRGLIGDLSQQRARLEADLSTARLQSEELESELDMAQVHLQETQASVEAALDNAVANRRAQMDTNIEVVASATQELRTPMSSIMGYTDLLLSESVGILGAMQRNFLQRVKANIERMDNLLETLVRVTTLDIRSPQLLPEPVDVVTVIEDAIMGASNQFRERGITLRMDLADDMLPVHADRDALQQVIAQMLANACLASPLRSEVLLTARQQESALPGLDGAKQHVPSLFVAVADQGGGVSAEDLERVFRRKYRAENPLIEGLGDTGVGLSIAKTLVEAHQGHIWVESVKGEGSKFMFAIPIEASAAQDERDEHNEHDEDK